MSIYLARSDEQAFLAEAAADALGRQDTVAAAREVLDGAPRPDLWPLAVQAGWPGLVSGDDVDGAGLGPAEAVIVLEAAGRRLADLGLLGHLPAALLLEEGGADPVLRAAVAAGERRAALVDGELTHAGAVLRLGGAAASSDAAAGSDGEALRAGGDVLRAGGEARGVIDLPGADVLVVVGDHGVGVLEAPPGGPDGPSYDGARRVGALTLDGAQLTPLDVAEPSRGRDLQRLLLAAESLGSAEACLELTRAYAIDRHAFGRAIGSFQAIKHKLVEMLRRVENARSLVAAAGEATEPAQRALLANAARVAAADALDYCAPEAIFVHGGVGATWEHDASLFYRRAESSRRLAGGIPAAARTVGGLLLAEAQPA